LLHQRTNISSDYVLIIQNIRLPRILLGIIVGASLSVAGTSFQALLRNPLADPYVLGVSSGAGLGAILALIVEPHVTLSPVFAALLTPLGAFLGASATVAAVYFLGRREGQIDSTTLLLGGVITASFISAIIMFLMSTLTGNLRGLSFWLMGDLSTPLQKSVYWFLAIGFVAASGAIYTTASDLNLLLAGEKEAMHLGVDVPRIRLVVYISASLLTGLAVSVSGAIGYVGLIVPHVMRLIFGSDHRTLLPDCRDRRSHCGCIRRHARAHRRCAQRARRRRRDRRRRRAAVHLPPAQEARMSPGSSHARHLAEAGRLANEIR